MCLGDLPVRDSGEMSGKSSASSDDSSAEMGQACTV